ncbi:MAG: galactokinase [Dehalococcoidia bacterium]
MQYPDFAALFGRAAAVTARAPGRVNVIGEHTDYNGGFVLPIGIPLGTTVELAPRDDTVVRAWTAFAEVGATAERYALGEETPGRGWLDYVQGVTATLRADGAAGAALRGFDARIESTLPVGRGLSSSAALMVALLRALREAFGLHLDDLRLARAAQRAENEFVGARVGIMDPLACLLADDRTAVFIDTRALTHEFVPLPDDLDLFVIDSGIPHRTAEGGYNRRREECERAAELLGVSQLRDVTVADWTRINLLPEPYNRRARHVVGENERVLRAVRAMRAGDLSTLAGLLFHSHASLRDDFEVSTPELDLLVDLARVRHEVYAARMTGAGFGGSIMGLARAGTAERVAWDIVRAYTGRVADARAAVVLPAAPDD